MSISLLLDTGSTALTAQRIALEVTGENVTNVNTPGYSRQTAMLVSQAPVVVNGLPLGAGVKVATIQRSYDSFLQSQLTAANAASGQASTTNSALQMVQPLFSDLSGTGLGTTLQSFFSAWQDLTANPQGVPERQAVMSRAQQLVDDFHRVSSNLTDIKDNMDLSLVGITTDANDMLKQVATLNGLIKQVEIQGGQANEMRDQRELLVRDIALKVGVNSVEQPDGTLTVTLPPPNSQTLVEGKNYASLSLETDPDNSGYYSVMLTPSGSASAVDVTSFIGGPDNSMGAIGAALQVRDTVVDKYLVGLNELATTLVSQVNSVHAAGFGLSGTTGKDFFNAATTAAGIEVDLASPYDIAAADVDPATGGTGNNKNAQSMASIYDQSFAMTGGSMTLGDFYTALVGKVGVDVQNAGRADKLNLATLNQLNSQRESKSGVSLDEELVNLTKYQMAYQGAAKMINVGTEMLDTVLGLIR